MLENEMTWRSGGRGARSELAAIWAAMQACVRRGCEREGVLPGGLKVRRRAAGDHDRLRSDVGRRRRRSPRSIG